MPKRIDAADTIDAATHFLHRLQADGWGLEALACDIEYQSPRPGARKLPIAATVTVRLTPARD